MVVVKFGWKTITFFYIDSVKKIRKIYKENPKNLVFFNYLELPWAKIQVKKNYTTGVKKQTKTCKKFSKNSFLNFFSKSLNFEMVAVKFGWKRNTLLVWKKKEIKKISTRFKIINFGEKELYPCWEKIIKKFQNKN